MARGTRDGWGLSAGDARSLFGNITQAEPPHPALRATHPKLRLVEGDFQKILRRRPSKKRVVEFAVAAVDVGAELDAVFAFEGG